MAVGDHGTITSQLSTSLLIQALANLLLGSQYELCTPGELGRVTPAVKPLVRRGSEADQVTAIDNGRYYAIAKGIRQRLDGEFECAPISFRKVSMA